MAPTPINSEILGWNDLDDRAIKYARALAADAVQRAGNGHPGTAMALAPVRMARNCLVKPICSGAV